MDNLYIENRKFEIQIYKPDIKECICDKKILLSRAKVPFSRQNDLLYLNSRINRIILQSIRNSNPKIFYTDLNVKNIDSKLIPKSFEGIKSLTIFISTLGEIFDKFVENLSSNGKYFEMLFADSWGSESLESINRSFDKKLREKYKNGTMRFSPGYQDIDITANKIIVNEIFNIKEIKVYDSGIIYPRKTTICFIGWFI